MKSGRRRWFGLALGTVAASVAGEALASAPAMAFEMYKDKAGGFRWRLKASNGQIVATSGQGYKAKAECKHEIEQIQKHAAAARIDEAAE